MWRRQSRVPAVMVMKMDVCVAKITMSMPVDMKVSAIAHGPSKSCQA
jgi:hypothetical protein